LNDDAHIDNSNVQKKNHPEGWSKRFLEVLRKE